VKATTAHAPEPWRVREFKVHKACRHLLSAAAVAALVPLGARADDLTVSTAQTTPVATATAANAKPGNVTVATGGSIIVGTGTAVTINSNNSLTANGTISSSAATGGIGVLFDATNPLTANLTGTSVISVTGTGGANNFGVSLVGGGTVTGTIALSTTSSITVTGDNATAFSLATPFLGNIALNGTTTIGANSTNVAILALLTGNLTITGSNSATGAGSYGLNVAAPVTGTVRNAGTIAVGTAQSSGANGTLVAGAVGTAGVRISANVGTGFLNDSYYVDSTGALVLPTMVDLTKDKLITGAIASTGTAPALWIAPTSTAPQAVLLGALGTGNDAYAVVNRGNISTNYATGGQAVTAILIGGNLAASTTLAGGLNSQLGSGISATSLDGRAIAIEIGTGATVPTILNQGTISSLAAQTAASGSVAAKAGGVASAIVVDQGANVQTINNVGLIGVTSRGAGNSAYGIVDRSGTVTAIINSGTINVVAPTDATTVARAIDLTASNGPVTVTNNNIIKGDIAFGNGASKLAVTGGSIVGAVIFGTGANRLALSSTGVFNTALTSPTALAVTLADSSRLDFTSITAPIASIAATGSSTLIIPVNSTGVALAVSGSASFMQNSSIQLSLQSLALAQNITVLQAGGGITTDHLATLLNPAISPYLYTVSAPTLTANTLSVQLVRKTADQIGLTANQAALFNASLVGLPAGSPESAAIANLPSQSAVVAAYAGLAPPSFGRALLRSAQDFADSGFGATAARLDEIDQLRHHRVRGVGAWVQEYGNFGRQADGANDIGFRNNNFGFAGGVDVPLLGLDAVGAAVVSNFITSKRYPGGAAQNYDVTGTTIGFQPYASWSSGPVFVEAEGLYAHTDYTTHHTLAIGPLTDQVSANWSSSQYGGGVTVGARLKHGRLRITPTNSVTYTALDQNGYTEQGGGAFDLRVASQKDHIFSDTGRVAVAYLLPINIDTTLKFEVHGAYQKIFQADPTRTLAQFVNGGDWIPLLGDKVDTSKTQYGAMVGYLQENVALKLDYDRGESSGYKDNAFALTAGMVF
jgi:uncharacterized protein with beta-barrel porin domain